MTELQSRIRAFITDCLLAWDDREELQDDDSLFLSGRLDSLSVTRLVVFLEEELHVDFGANPFDVTLLDSVEQIADFVQSCSRPIARSG